MKMFRDDWEGLETNYDPKAPYIRLSDMLDIEIFKDYCLTERTSINLQAHEMLNIQGMSGTWDYDHYMHGMYNGMEYMLAIFEEREPKFRDAPNRWLRKECDRLAPELYKDTTTCPTCGKNIVKRNCEV